MRKTVLLVIVCLFTFLVACDGMSNGSDGDGDSEKEAYTVSFFDGDILISSQSANIGSVVILESRIKSGFTFGGWQINGFGKIYNNSFIVTGNVELHARWLEGDWIKISAHTELYNISNDLSAKYILVADINLSDIANWELTGNFTGEFDGNGYKIINLKSNRSGLFGNVSGGIISNVALENVNLNCGSSAGGIANQVSGGIITNSYTAGNINASSNSTAYSGGIAGYVDNSKIINSYCSGNINASSTYSPSSDFFSSVYAYSGGIVGYISGGEITNSYSTGNISAYTNRHALSYAYSGGIAGRMSENIIRNSYSAGDITSSSGNSSVSGGITGRMSGNSAIINCVAANSVISGTSGYITNIGRIVASIDSYSALLFDNLASDIITGSFTDRLYNDGTTVSQAELEIPSTYTGINWNFADVWKMSVGNYPIFQWQ
ncbi:MAG: hypothetical protein LBH05_02855 [Deferribacteraceae bacterium]|nr:hypothetical protein [Deferribacteraceae bacterium]